MINSKQVAMDHLLIVEKNNRSYFVSRGIKILDCVRIIGDKMPSIHITKPDLPYEVRYEIETLIWRQ